MSGTISAGGLVTGLNTNSIIQQLMQLERQPIVRLEQRITGLDYRRRDALNGIIDRLTTLRDRSRDFQSQDLFSQFRATSSNADVLGADVSGQNPTTGVFSINVTQLASATTAQSSDVLGASIDPNAALDSSGIGTAVTAGDFTINGVTFNVDPTTQTFDDIMSAINSSSAGVTATYDSGSDAITIENSTPGDTSIINLGGANDTSNFLSAIYVASATQITGGNGSTVVSSSTHLGTVNPGAVLSGQSFKGGAVTAGSFRVNGVSINVDPTVDSLSDVIGRINGSDAGVTASYDSLSDTIRVVSDKLGDRTVGFQSDSSNFLDVANLTTATQTAGNNSEFTVDNGPVQSRNSNTLTDVIGGVTVTLNDVGTSTVNVAPDDEAIVEDVQALVDEFNGSVNAIRDAIGNTDGSLSADGSLRSIQNALLSTIFSNVSGSTGTFSNLVELGFSTGDVFVRDSDYSLEFDQDQFLEALRENPANVAALFTNEDGTGIADVLESSMEEAVGFQGYLRDRTRANGSIDRQIDSLQSQIDRLEDRVSMREERLRQEFSRLEQLTASYQQAGGSLSQLSGGLLQI